METRAAFCRGPSSFLYPAYTILPNSYKNPADLQPLDESYCKGQHADALAFATHRFENYLFRSETELNISLATGMSPALNSNALNELGLKILMM